MKIKDAKGHILELTMDAKGRMLDAAGNFIGNLPDLIIFIPTVGDYITPKLVGGTDGLMIANMIQVQFSKANNAPLAAALSVSSLMIVSFISIVFVLFNRKYLRRY